MRKEEFDNIARKRPFQPFEIRMVDGRKFRFHSPEQFIVSRSSLYTLDENGDGLFINIALIATIRLYNGSKHRG